MIKISRDTFLLKGFTLIELLVVIAIIGLLSAVMLAPIQSSRKKARDAKRSSEMKNIQTALQVYFDDNGTYPVVTAGVDTGWRSQCASYGGYANNMVMPGLVPNYLPRLPVDPLNTATAGNEYCYLYRSNGSEYKLLLHNVPESIPAPANFYDPQRPTWAWKICEGVVGCLW